MKITVLTFLVKKEQRSFPWCRAVQNLRHAIRSTIQIWVVMRHQYVPQSSFRGETSGGVAICRLLSQARTN